MDCKHTFKKRRKYTNGWKYVCIHCGFKSRTLRKTLRKKSLGIKKKKNYRLLHKDGIVEIRKYPPCYRTLLRGSGCKPVFVPLPYQVFAGVKCSHCSGYGPGRLFFAAFAGENDKVIYPSPFRSLSSPVCIDNQWHYRVPSKADLTEAIRRYWGTYFHDPHTMLKRLFNVETLREWAKLSPERVLEINYAERTVEGFVDDVLRIKQRHEDRYNRYKGIW